MGSNNNNGNGNGNAPSKLERSLSLTSEPRTLRQYEMAIASMQAMEKQHLTGTINGITKTTTTTSGGAKKKGDREEGASGAAAAARLQA